MRFLSNASTRFLMNAGTRFMPFADAASNDLPLPRLLRLSLFQISVGMATALLVGTLNRVMIVELGVSATIVAAMVAIPLLFAPLRAFIGFRSDRHRSALGWRRVPFIWFGTMVQFSGLSIMPFALLLLSDAADVPFWFSTSAGALAFLLVGAGLQITQTAGLALATDLAPEDKRPRVVALMYVTLLAGMMASSVVFYFALADFSPTRLIQVIQSAAMITIGLNLIALWKQEARDRARALAAAEPAIPFRTAWALFTARPNAKRFLLAVFLGTLAFNMQDIVLEPYGGEVLGLSVSATTFLTALLASGALLAFGFSAMLLTRGIDPYRLAAYGVVLGLPGFAMVLLAAPVESTLLFRIGAFVIGFAGGMFSVGTLTAAMGLDTSGNGLALGAWGAVQATAAGLAMVAGGALQEFIASIAAKGLLGKAFEGNAPAYGVVYNFEILLLFLTLIVIGPLARHWRAANFKPTAKFGLGELPS